METRIAVKEENVQVNTESVQCIVIAYSEARITELRRVDRVVKIKRSNFRSYINNVQVLIVII